MLPKIEYPIHEVELKSLDRKVRMRPMTGKEEKLLLLAKASDNENDIFTAIKQVVNNCLMDDRVDVDKLPMFELEYVFLDLRMKSIGDSVDLRYHDNEDGKDYKFTVKLEDVKMKYPDVQPDPKVQITDEVGIVMRYPPASLYDNGEFLQGKDPQTLLDEMLVESVAKVYDSNDVYEAKDIPRDELREFLDSIDSVSLRKMSDFLDSTPHMEYTIHYKNSLGTDRDIVLRTLNDFFTF